MPCSSILLTCPLNDVFGVHFLQKVPTFKDAEAEDQWTWDCVFVFLGMIYVDDFLFNTMNIHASFSAGRKDKKMKLSKGGERTTEAELFARQMLQTVHLLTAAGLKTSLYKSVDKVFAIIIMIMPLL